MTTVTIKDEQFTIKDTTVETNCPDDSWAKLMYYLNCVESVIDYGFPEKILKFKEYQNITFDDKNLILMLAEVMSPSFFEEKHIFINDADLSPNFNNTFYSVTFTKLSDAATKEFVIAGKHVQTLQLMAFRPIWKEKFYTTPMLEFKDRLIDIHYGRADKYRKQEKSSACLLI